MNAFRVAADPALTEAYAELQALAARWQARARARAAVRKAWQAWADDPKRKWPGPGLPPELRRLSRAEERAKARAVREADWMRNNDGSLGAVAKACK